MEINEERQQLLTKLHEGTLSSVDALECISAHLKLTNASDPAQASDERELGWAIQNILLEYQRLREKGAGSIGFGFGTKLRS